MNVTIREAIPEDTHALAELLALLMVEHHLTPPSAERRIHAIEQAMALAGTWFYVAIIDDTIVGALQLNERYSTWTATRYGYIEDFCVATSLRSRGVGARLLQHVATIAQGHGWARIDLDVSHSLPDSIRFYERNGYANTGSLLYRKECTLA